MTSTADDEDRNLAWIEPESLEQLGLHRRAQGTADANRFVDWFVPVLSSLPPADPGDTHAC